MNHEVINRVKFNWHKVSKNVVVLKEIGIELIEVRIDENRYSINKCEINLSKR